MKINEAVEQILEEQNIQNVIENFNVIKIEEMANKISKERSFVDRGKINFFNFFI